MTRALITKEEGISDASIDNFVNEFCSQFGSGRKKAKLLLTAMRKSNMSIKHHTLAVRFLHILVRCVSITKGEGSTPSVTQLEKATDLFEDWCNTCDSKHKFHKQSGIHIGEKITMDHHILTPF